MPKSPLRLFKSIKEFIPRADLSKIPKYIRGVYVLYEELDETKYKVKYIGVSERSVKGRIVKHVKSESKNGGWDHFSVYEVHDNISDEEVKELESVILFIYRKDPTVNMLNALRSTKALVSIKRVPLGGYGPQPKKR